MSTVRNFEALVASKCTLGATIVVFGQHLRVLAGAGLAPLDLVKNYQRAGRNGPDELFAHEPAERCLAQLDPLVVGNLGDAGAESRRHSLPGRQHRLGRNHELRKSRRLGNVGGNGRFSRAHFAGVERRTLAIEGLKDALGVLGLEWK